MSVQNILDTNSFAVVRFLQMARPDILAGLWDRVDEEEILRVNDFQRGKMSAHIQLVLDALAAGATSLEWSFQGPEDPEDEDSEYGVLLTINMYSLPFPLYFTVTDLQLNRLKRQFREVMYTVAIDDNPDVSVATVHQSTTGMAIETLLTQEFTLSTRLLRSGDGSIEIELGVG